MKNCPECGTEAQEDRKFCGECGAPLDAQANTTDAAPAVTSESPPESPPPDGAQNAPEGEPETAPIEIAPGPMSINVSVACRHVCGPVKENDQDHCHAEVIDFPLHGYRVVILTGSDGIGGGTGGERWAHTTSHLFAGAMGARIPSFDRQEKFPDREQFWQLLTEKVKTYFFPVVNWVTGVVYNFGLAEVGTDTHKRPRVFGCTWVAAVLVCDLWTGRVAMHGYSVGDSNFFLVTSDQIEKLNTDHVRDGRLDRWVGQGQSANGQVFTREWEFNADTLTSLRVVLCSDGVSNMLSPEDIATTAREHTDPSSVVDAIIQRALNVEVPYGFLQNPEAEIPVTVGDDNMFVVDLTIQSR